MSEMKSVLDDLEKALSKMVGPDLAKKVTDRKGVFNSLFPPSSGVSYNENYVLGQLAAMEAEVTAGINYFEQYAQAFEVSVNSMLTDPKRYDSDRTPVVAAFNMWVGDRLGDIGYQIYERGRALKEGVCPGSPDLPEELTKESIIVHFNKQV